MKVAGIILIILQVASFIPVLASGENIFANGFANLIGRCLLGIVGVILLIIAHKRSKKQPPLGALLLYESAKHSKTYAQNETTRDIIRRRIVQSAIF